MQKHVVMIIANSPNPSYFSWFAELNAIENNFKFTFIFLATAKPDLTEKLKKYNVTSRWYYFDFAPKKHWQYIKLFSKLFFLFRKIKPDVVQTNLFDDSFVALFAARLAGVKKRVITKQDTGYHISYCPKFIPYDRFNNSNATDILPVSQESMELILKYEKPDPSKIKIVHHAVDQDRITVLNPEEILSLKNKYNLHNKIVVGTVSRYVFSKGYFEIVEAINILVKQFPNLVFIAAGWGPQKDKITEAIKKNGLESHFLLVDKINFDSMPSFYKCLDIYVHAAHYEPFGFVYAEAMFNKIPIVSTRVGAALDALKHKESCYFSDFKSPEQIAEGIAYLINDPVAKQDMAQKAYEIAKANFSKEIMWDNYKSIFSS